MYIYTILHDKGVFQFWMCARLFPQILMCMYSHLFKFEIFCHSVYMCTRMHIHTKTYIHKNIHIYIQTDVCIHIHVYIWMYTSAYIYHDAFSCFVSHACTRAHKGGEKREIQLVASPNKHLQYLWIFMNSFIKLTCTRWRRPIECLIFMCCFCKRTLHSVSLWRKETCNSRCAWCLGCGFGTGQW